MIDFLDVIRTESARFAACARAGNMAAPVPSCPEWDFADLVWHLTEVQHFWGSVADRLLLDPAVVDALVRPDISDLVATLEDRSAFLLAALSRHPPEARCWSWYDDGWSIGWTRRRQAHEAVIHRVDAELVVGHLTEVDEAVASDGIDELLHTMIDGVPEWADFIPDHTHATLSVDGGAVYGLRFGRIVGTAPESGKDYDFDTFLMGDPAGTVIGGSPSSIYLWLWGRGGGGVRCEDQFLLSRVRAVVAGATQ